jgi:hypothetical protein
VSRGGEGPGELARPPHVEIGIGDTLLVAQKGRIDVWGPDFRYVRSIPSLTVPGGLRQIGDGRILSFNPISADFLTAITSDGEAEAFGSRRPTPTGCSACRVRMFEPAREPTQFYAIPLNAYQLEKWDASGELIGAFEVESDWFPKEPPPEGPRPLDEPPRPSLSGLSLDDRGFMWLFGWYANERWRSPAERGLIRGRGRTITIRALMEQGLDNTGFTTAVDVVDPGSGRVVASARLEGDMWFLFDGRRAYTRRQTDEGYVFLDIWEFALVRPTGRGLELTPPGGQ